MAEQHVDESTQQTSRAMKRRGILAAAGAVVAGFLAKQAAQPVAATTFPDTVFAPAFIAQGGSGVGYQTGSGGYNVGMSVSGDTGVIGNAASGDGVSGYSRTSYGVRGHTGGTDVNISGVKGEATAGVTNGVWGENTSTETNATGVFGLATTADTTGPTVGVWGRSQSTTAGSIGTFGEAVAAGTYGVVGRAKGAGGIGVAGQIPNTSSAASTVAVQATNQSTASGGIGVQATCDHGIGGSFKGSVAPLLLVPGTLASTALTAAGHQAGELYMTSDHLLFCFDGTAWKQLLFAAPPTTVPPPSGPPPPVTGNPSVAPPGRSSVGSGPGKQAATPNASVPPAPPSRP